MLHHEYETIVIVRPDVEESGVAALADKFEGVLTEQGGHILDRENWGSRKLAYPIAKHLRGHFIRMNYLADSSHIAELERKMRIEDGVIRFMTVRLADSVDVPTRIEEAAVHRAQREEEERRRAEEQAERERLEAERAALEGASYESSYGDRDRGDRGDREQPAAAAPATAAPATAAPATAAPAAAAPATAAPAAPAPADSAPSAPAPAPAEEQ